MYVRTDEKKLKFKIHHLMTNAFNASTLVNPIEATVHVNDEKSQNNN